MLVYIVRRLLLAAIVFVAVSFLSFVLLAAPLDPLWKKYGPARTPERIAEARTYDMDDPAVERYWLWVKGTITGAPEYATRTVCGQRAGGSACRHLRIWPQAWTATKRTAVLAGLSVVAIVFFSLFVGSVAAARPGSALDGLLRTGSYLTWSIPAFVVAVLLQLLLSKLALTYDFRPFPVSGRPLPGEAATGVHFVLVWLQHLALPVLTISIGFIGAYSRYIRSVMLVSLNEAYTTTARAKGLPERRVVLHHALRNSMIPFVSLLTLEFGALFGATLVADYVFRQEGLASFLAQTTYDADPFELQTLVLVGAVSVLVFSLIGDLVNARLDPRIRLS